MKEIEIKIDREKILHRIKLDTYYSGESRKEGDKVLVATKAQASDEEDDILIIYIETASAKVIDVLTSLLKKVCPSREETTTDSGNGTELYIYKLDVPLTFDMNQVSAMTTAIEDIMANYALMEWAKRTLPDMLPAYADNVGAAKQDLGHRIVQRIKPVRRPTRPLGF